MFQVTVHIIYRLGVKAIINLEWLLKLVADTICTIKLTRPICSILVYIATGYDPNELLVVREKHNFKNTSTRTIQKESYSDSVV